MRIISIIVGVILSFCAAAIGQLFTGSAITTWYAALNRPVIAPPNWVFAPVWTILYLMMGISAGLVWNKGIGDKAVKFALVLFVIQLILNSLWSIIFFGWHQILFAFIEIIVLWLFILWTLVKFYALSPVAGLLLVPYLLWVSFASVLNFSFWWVNR